MAIGHTHTGNSRKRRGSRVDTGGRVASTLILQNKKCKMKSTQPKQHLKFGISY